MGNAIKKPGRFFEKKIEHEIFGIPDPRMQREKYLEYMRTKEKCHEKYGDLVTGPNGIIVNNANALTPQDRAKVGADIIAHSVAVSQCIKNNTPRPPKVTPKMPTFTKPTNTTHPPPFFR
jgi:hypothetical protein